MIIFFMGAYFSILINSKLHILSDGKKKLDRPDQSLYNYAQFRDFHSFKSL